MTSSVAAVTSNIAISTNITASSRPLTRGATKATCSDSGVVESDTDTMSYDDDSSPDHYQPIGSHFSGAWLRLQVDVWSQRIGVWLLKQDHLNVLTVTLMISLSCQMQALF